jgi:hypothetical protein
VKANGNTVDSDIQFFADAAKTDQIYLAQDLDCFTVPYHVDAEAWATFSPTNDLGSDKVYYTITNNGANASTYEIVLVGFGEV